MGPDSVITEIRLAAGDLCLGASLIPVGYAECAEFSDSGTLDQVTRRITGQIEELNRIELLAVIDGVLVGYACAAVEEDMHVGLCLSLQWQYVVPEHRGKIGGEFLRWLVRVGRDMGFRYVAYSHRVSARHYAIKYRRVRHEQG